MNLEQTLNSPLRSAIAAATGLADSEIGGMSLFRYSETGLRGIERAIWRRAAYQRWAWKSWLRRDRWAWCPSCLGENNGRWMLNWCLGWSFACVKHAVMLLDQCPGCDSRISTSVSRCGTLRLQCAAPMTGKSRCEFPLDEAPTLPVLDTELLGYQRRIDAWLDLVGCEGIPPLPEEFGPLMQFVLEVATPPLAEFADPAFTHDYLWFSLYSGWNSTMRRMRSRRIAAAVQITAILLDFPSPRDAACWLLETALAQIPPESTLLLTATVPDRQWPVLPRAFVDVFAASGVHILPERKRDASYCEQPVSSWSWLETKA